MRQFVLALALGGCAVSPAPEALVLTDPTSADVVVCVESRVFTARPALVHGVVGEWSKALGIAIAAIEDAPGLACDVQVAERDDACESGLMACAWLMGRDGTPGYIALVPGVWTRDPAYVLSHEIGHAFGALHTDTGLMRNAPPDGSPSCPDVAAVAAVVEAGVIDVGAISPCEGEAQ